jgi:peptidoglycan/xylan/chitin deacetylase (PgdA/CDA1 family)/glycosyltransferase involved in cell wall biosynthesis
MNILHVLSQVFVSGPEFYVAALADHHRNQGHETVIISDTFTAPTNAAILQAPLAKRDILTRLSNIAMVRKVVKERHIDIVHAHSRAASWVCFWAVKGTGAAFVSTVHGRQHIHFSTKFSAIYGTSVIAVCENIASHLIRYTDMRPQRIRVIPNGINRVHKGETVPPPRGKVLSIIGRVNGPKGAQTAAFIKSVAATLLESHPDLVIRVAGGDCDKLPDNAKLEISRLNKRFGNRIETPGFVKDLGPLLQGSSIVLCSGRVAIESLFLGVPTIALGEACYSGLVTEENFKDAAASNFGDVLAHKKADRIDFIAVGRDITSALEQGVVSPAISRVVHEYYDAQTVAQKVMDVYRGSRILKKHPGPIPVLMYHKIPDAMLATRHRTFIPKKRFERHLRFFRIKGFSTMTFADYDDFAKGVLPMASFPKKPLIITFDDGYESVVSNALPLMNAFGFRGVIFLLGDNTARYNFWDSNQEDFHDKLAQANDRQLFKTAGWEIGAHTMTHRDLPKLDAMHAEREIVQCKRRLEQEFSVAITAFAYPFGSCDERIKSLVAKAGFSFGVATDCGPLRIEDDRFQVFRINIFPQDSFLQIWKKTSSWYRRYYAWKRRKNQ